MTVFPLFHYGEGKMVEFSFLALMREHGDEPGRVYLLIVREEMDTCCGVSFNFGGPDDYPEMNRR